MNKKHLIFLSFLVFILIINFILYFSGNQSKRENAIKTNKLFEINLDSEKKNNDFNFKVVNNIKELNEKYNSFIPNFSILFFDIDINSLEKISEISNIIFAPRFGFKKISLDFLKKIQESETIIKNNIYIRIFIKNNNQEESFSENSIISQEDKNSDFIENSSSIDIDNSMNLYKKSLISYSNNQYVNNSNQYVNNSIISKSDPKEIIINTKYFFEENKEIFIQLQKLKEFYGINFYIEEEDISFLDNNDDLIKMLIDLRPLLINSNQTCNSGNSFCFFSKSQKIKSILDQIKILKDEIFENKIERKNILFGFSVERNDISFEDFAKKIRDLIYSGPINNQISSE